MNYSSISSSWYKKNYYCKQNVAGFTDAVFAFYFFQVGGSYFGPEFNQAGSAKQGGVQLSGPPQFPGHMGPSNQPPRQSAVIQFSHVLSNHILGRNLSLSK